jgi:transcriptional regulator with XRE-family HTH domain
MATAPDVARKSADFDRFDVLSRMGDALSRVKSAHRLTLQDMEDLLGKSVDQIARYIAGDEMPASVWMKALYLWPELAERFEETTAERAMQSRQVPLDLTQPRGRAA